MLAAKVFLLTCALLAAVHFRTSNALVEPLEYLPRELQANFETCRSSGDLTKNSARLVYWLSVNQFCSKFVKSRPDLTPSQNAYLINSLREAIAPIYESEHQTGKRKKRQLGVRVRPEARTMNRNQRRRYFAGVNAMKRNRELPPNVFDFLANYHTGDNLRAAHFGPAFLSWHRLYLWIFEFFLRREVPGTSLPYWASEIDNEMDDSSLSTIWHEDLFGYGEQGFPDNGPFVSWRAINESSAFIRDVTPGQLFNYEEIDRFVNSDRMANITVPLANPENNLEFAHGRAHVRTGGFMSGLNTAAYDPVFFSHHANVDKIYNDFQLRQVDIGINPAFDYPFVVNDTRFREEHDPNFNAGFAGLRGASRWTQRLGLSNAFRTLVRYAPTPSCANRCGNSDYLYCNRAVRRCVSYTRVQFDSRNRGQGGRRTKRAPVINMSPAATYIPEETCPKRPFINDVDTRIMGLSAPLPNTHSNDWAYVAFNVVSKRSEGYHKFDKYSLYNQGTNAHLGNKGQFIQRSIQYKFKDCDKYLDAVGKITVVAHGLNYDGRSQEVVFVDNRLGVSEAKGFIPIKMPYGSKPSEVIISAFDSCGRVCKPFCKTNSNGAMGTYFHGGIRVSRTAPKQYADTYADAQFGVWDVPTQTSCPKTNYDNIPISFFCDYTDSWIWGDSNVMSGHGGMRGQGMQSRAGHVSRPNTGSLRGHQGGLRQVPHTVSGQGTLADRWQGSNGGTGQGVHTQRWQGIHSNPTANRRGGRRGGRRRTGGRGSSRMSRPSRPQHMSPIGSIVDLTIPSSGRYTGRTA